MVEEKNVFESLNSVDLTGKLKTKGDLLLTPVKAAISSRDMKRVVRRLFNFSPIFKFIGSITTLTLYVFIFDKPIIAYTKRAEKSIRLNDKSKRTRLNLTLSLRFCSDNYFNSGILPVSLLTFFLGPQIATPKYCRVLSGTWPIFSMNSS